MFSLQMDFQNTHYISAAITENQESDLTEGLEQEK